MEMTREDKTAKNLIQIQICDAQICGLALEIWDAEYNEDRIFYSSK